MDQLKTAIREKGIAVEELCQYSYDTNRNQTDIKNTKTGEDQTYVYDAENRLSQVSVTKDGKTAVIQQNIYNGEGQRIQKIDGDETINYYYQDGVVAYTTDTDGNQNSQNLIGTDGNVLATERFQQNATQYYLYNKDIQGSTSSLVKEAGQCEEYIEKSVGISTALCPYIGYAKSAEIAKKSLKTGISVKELVVRRRSVKGRRIKRDLKTRENDTAYERKSDESSIINTIRIQKRMKSKKRLWRNSELLLLQYPLAQDIIHK